MPGVLNTRSRWLSLSLCTDQCVPGAAERIGHSACRAFCSWVLVPKSSFLAFLLLALRVPGRYGFLDVLAPGVLSSFLGVALTGSARRALWVLGAWEPGSPRLPRLVRELWLDVLRVFRGRSVREVEE
jgi:hypothetical protein